LLQDETAPCVKLVQLAEPGFLGFTGFKDFISASMVHKVLQALSTYS
jgi:hypothetical protein